MRTAANGQYLYQPHDWGGRSVHEDCECRDCDQEDAPCTPRRCQDTASGGINVPTITMNLATTQTITTRIGGTGDLTIFNNANGTNLTLAAPLTNANNFTGNLVIGSGGSSVSDTNRVNLNAAGALPAT